MRNRLAANGLRGSTIVAKGHDVNSSLIDRPDTCISPQVNNSMQFTMSPKNQVLSENMGEQYIEENDSSVVR